MKRTAFDALGVIACGLLFVACSGGSSGGNTSAVTANSGSTAATTSAATTPATSATPAAPATATPAAAPVSATPENFKVAFVGDSGVGPDAVAVLNLIKNEGAKCVVHQGDMGYGAGAADFETMVDSVLGANYPYFASPGNHDAGEWDGATGYRARFEARMNRIGIKWTGTLGEESTHTFGGVLFVLVGPDVTGPGDGNYDAFIKNSLDADDSIWSVASWHKNMNTMQCGGKGDDTGWGVYEESRRGGAIVATGHEHSYSRTHMMSNFETQAVASTGNTLTLAADDPNTAADEGRSFCFVSGLAGRGARNQDRGGAWWAKIYTSDQNAEQGALFGEFHVNGNPRLARFYFKTITNVIIDEFFVLSDL